jgi:ribosomal protein S6
VERVIASLASEVKALDYAIEGEKQQQATYRIANIKAARRELKALLRDADLI